MPSWVHSTRDKPALCSCLISWSAVAGHDRRISRAAAKTNGAANLRFAIRLDTFAATCRTRSRVRLNSVPTASNVVGCLPNQPHSFVKRSNVSVACLKSDNGNQFLFNDLCGVQQGTKFFLIFDFNNGPFIAKGCLGIPILDCSTQPQSARC